MAVLDQDEVCRPSSRFFKLGRLMPILLPPPRHQRALVSVDEWTIADEDEAEEVDA